MTGWRLGWLIGPKPIIKILTAFQSQSMGCPNSIVQKAFEEAVDLCEKDLKDMVKELKKHTKYFNGRSKGYPGLKCFPSHGAFYLWLNVQGVFGRKYKGEIIKQ